MIKAVIFDLDDTFSLTEATSFELENTVLKQMGRPPMSHEVHLKTWEKPLSEVFPLRSPGTDAEAFKVLYQPMLAEYVESGKLDIIPDANYEALDALAVLGKTLVVLTSRTPDRVKHLLDPEHVLARRVKTFYHRGNSRFRKPDPRVFDALLTETGLRPEQCVYVGDSLHDARAAKKAGLYFIASLESGLRKKEDFADFSVDLFVAQFPDVVDAVRRLEKI